MAIVLSAGESDDIRLAMVRRLLERGADPNLPLGEGRMAKSPMVRAARINKLEMLKLLVEHGGDVSATSGTTEETLAGAVLDTWVRREDVEQEKSQGMVVEMNASLDLLEFLHDSGLDCRKINAGMSLLAAGALHDNEEVIRFVAEKVGFSPDEMKDAKWHAETYECQKALDLLTAIESEGALLMAEPGGSMNVPKDEMTL